MPHASPSKPRPRLSPRASARVAWAALACLALSAAAGCGAKTAPDPSGGGDGDGSKAAAGEVVQVDFWYSYGGRNREVTEALVERFNASHPNIRVKATFQGDYFESLAKLRIASRTRRGPVVTHIIGEALPALYKEGLFEPLDAYAAGKVDGAAPLDAADFIPALTQQGYFDTLGQDVPLFALPFNRSTPVVYYNVRMFQEAGVAPPKTWDELVEVSRKLTVRDGDTTKVWGFELPVDWWFWYAMLHQAGGSLLNADGTKAAFNQGPGKEALGLLARMVHDESVMKHPPGRDYSAWEVANTDFLNEKVAMIWTSTAFLGYFKDNAKFEFGTAFLPGKVKQAVPTGGTFFVVLKNKPDPEKRAAWTFVRWMTDTAQTQEWSQKTGYMPVRKSALTSDAMKAFYAENPAYKTTLDQLEHAVPFPFSPHLLEIQRAFLQPNLERPIVDKVDVGVVLDEAAAKTDALLAKP